MNIKRFIGPAVEILSNGQPYLFRESDSGWELEWFGNTPKPLNEDVEAKAAELAQEWINNEYQRKRLTEYPPVTDYIDGLVKGDQAQMQAYIDACLAVKAKYPKPSENNNNNGVV